MKEKLEAVLWDKTNIGENFPGVTLPLTTSFVKTAYATVYNSFLDTLTVPKDRRIRPDTTELIGTVHGQLYYNLIHWYELIGVFPFGSHVRKSFEAMLSPVLDHTQHSRFQVAPPRQNRIPKLVRFRILVCFVILCLIYPLLNFVFDGIWILLTRRFTHLMEKMLSNKELMARFEKIRNRFFSIWAIPIINDFRLMFFFGFYTSYTKYLRISDTERGSVLTKRVKQPVSLTVLDDIRHIVGEIKQDKKFQLLFRDNIPNIIWEYITENPEIRISVLIRRYLNHFGDRTSNELKLEEPSFRDQPVLFISLLKNLLVQQARNRKQYFAGKRKKEFSGRINTGVKLLSFLVASAVSRREKYRLRRVQAFGMANKVYRRVGKNLVDRGKIHRLSDIYYLTDEEVKAGGNLPRIVSKRKLLYQRYQKSLLPRLVIAKKNGDIIKSIIKPVRYSQNKNIQGMGVSPGVVEGEAIVMQKFKTDKQLNGKVLVTTTTDPGWTVLFPFVAGVVTEFGGTLSHAAIVAREYGIPCIVAVPDATQKIASGDIIRMDANKGTITIISRR